MGCRIKMETWEGKSFSITDPKGVNTVIYQINKTRKEDLEDSPKYTIERLDYMEELRGDMKRKTFFVDNPSKYEDQLVILSFGDNKVVVNMALLHDNEVSICKKPSSLKFENLYQEKEYEVRDFKYTPNLKRPICIIDPETAEEIKPTLYYKSLMLIKNSNLVSPNDILLLGQDYNVGLYLGFGLLGAMLASKSIQKYIVDQLQYISFYHYHNFLV